MEYFAGWLAMSGLIPRSLFLVQISFLSILYITTFPSYLNKMFKNLKITSSLKLLYFLPGNPTTQYISNGFWQRLPAGCLVLILHRSVSLGQVREPLWFSGPSGRPFCHVPSHHCRFKSYPYLKAHFKFCFRKLSLILLPLHSPQTGNNPLALFPVLYKCMLLESQGCVWTLQLSLRSRTLVHSKDSHVERMNK